MNWPIFLSAVFSGVAIWVLGLRLKRNTTSKLADQETGREVEIDRKHTLFFVPMHYWGIIVVVLSIVIAFAE